LTDSSDTQLQLFFIDLMELKLVLVLFISCAFGTVYQTGNIQWDIRVGAPSPIGIVEVTMFSPYDGNTHADLVDGWFFMNLNGMSANAATYVSLLYLT
jgi:hypothetical protein